MDLSYEFKVINNLFEDQVIPIYKELTTAEEVASFREEFPEVPQWMIPKKIVIGEDVEEVMVKEDVETRRLIPNILNITLQEAIDSEGNVYKDRYWVEEEGRARYTVKGSFSKMKAYRKKITKSRTIGY